MFREYLDTESLCRPQAGGLEGGQPGGERVEELTERQREILTFIVKETESRGFPPTIREIGEEMEIRSTNGVNDHLKALERKGYLLRGEQQSRSLVPTKRARLVLGLGAKKDADLVDVPVLGRVAAGAPLLATENIEDSVRIDSFLLGGNGREVFALRVKGESMIEDGIFDGDFIFVRKAPSAQPGDIVVALIEDEATVKRYYPEGDRVRFQPANATMQPIYVHRSEFRSTMILGQVVGVYRRLQGARA
jgi:repressor LexA